MPYKFELSYSCRQWKGGRNGGSIHILCINCCLNILPYTHTYIEFALLCRIMSVPHPLKKRMQRKAELTSRSRRRNWHMASGNWQLAKATWPGLHPIGQKVNFLCSACVVLLLISYVCYCCFCSSRVASWANGLLLAKLTHRHRRHTRAARSRRSLCAKM